MPYATLQSLIDRFTADEISQLEGHDVTDAGAVLVKVPRALADADAEVDAALVGRYGLPVVTVPDLLERIAADLAREALYTDAPPEVVVNRAKTARANLMAIAAGKLVLDIPAAAAQNSCAGLVEIVTGRKATPFGGF